MEKENKIFISLILTGHEAELFEKAMRLKFLSRRIELVRSILLAEMARIVADAETAG